MVHASRFQFLHHRYVFHALWIVLNATLRYFFEIVTCMQSKQLVQSRRTNSFADNNSSNSMSQKLRISNYPDKTGFNQILAFAQLPRKNPFVNMSSIMEKFANYY